MELWLVSIVVSLSTLCTAHYQGYPFKHMNDGRYGLQYKYANYKEEGTKPYIPPMTVSIAINGENFAFVPADKRQQMEFDFRHVRGFPVHLGNGQFYFLGNFKGSCEDTEQAGFYFTGDSKSYTVCENGRAHRFECPNGTKNRRSTYFQSHRTYDHSDLCSEHDNVVEPRKQPEQVKYVPRQVEDQNEEQVEEQAQEKPTETLYEGN